MHSLRSRNGLWLAAIAAVLFSAKAILAKFLYRHGIDAVTLIALRMLFSLPIFASVALIETWRARQRGDRLSWRECGQIIVLGIFGYYLSSFLDFWGLQYVSASLERLILFLNPSLVVLIGVLFLHRPVARAQWIAMGVSYLGIVLVFWEGLRLGGPRVAFGSALVFGAALSYALYLLMSGALVKRIGSLRLVAYAMCVSTLACLIQFALIHPLATLHQPAAVYGLSAINAVFCTVVPVYLTMFAIARIGPASTAQTAMIGPVSLVLLGWWLLDEPISTLQLFGTAVVMAGMWLLTRIPPQASIQPLTSTTDPI
jgi:drug/metabolite transporter (DMT)-like permease